MAAVINALLSKTSCYYRYSASVEVRSIVINTSVGASVCPRAYLWIEPIGTKFCVRIPCDRGSVLLRRRCATLCTSGFVDDITLGRNGRDAETWRLHRVVTAMSGVAIPGRSLMSMNACLFTVLVVKYD